VVLATQEEEEDCIN